ncbi:dye-decolorizing heme-containing peroxidase [Marasmius crinis-equi]|uniref:Dye-decolorizing heme-containing peroxidase n=1 Tax=Marasmius crinis-equi TaxID=585013 RepID=A0ABR3FIH4_9AGAR
MRSLVPLALGLLMHHGLARASVVQPRRNSPLLINPDAQPDLPSLPEAQAASAAVGLNLDDIQGDILIGMKKDKELFFFFNITDVATFKSKLKTDIHNRITSTTQLLDVATQPITAVNIAFSQSGLNALGVTDNLQDSNFGGGQFKDARLLGDPGTGNWVPGFSGTGIHGVILLASDTQSNIDNELKSIQSALDFGYMDGISQPAIQGFNGAPLPGQFVAKPGVILLGEDGDFQSQNRPAWTKSGSFLAFRQLKQRVPEFNKFLADHALSLPGLTQQENIDLLGARMVGRWKSGAPVDLAPLRDDPVLGADPQKNNDFTFDHPDLGSAFSMSTNQTFCPFSAHIQKSRPRFSLVNPELPTIHIMRAGIPYGPEVTETEATSQTSSDDPSLERGLAFVAYQSNLGNGFTFIQSSWVDNTFFPKGNVGVDPIIGSTNSGPPGNAQRTITGLDPTDFQKPMVLNEDFVVSRGGEYFFSPPISALISALSQ